MNYLFLVYGDEQSWDALSSAEREAFTGACLANHTALRESGHLLSAAELQASDTVIMVRLQQGELLLGGETGVKPGLHLNGFFVIRARDLNEAIRLATLMPQAQAGAIEVRPILETVWSTDKPAGQDVSSDSSPGSYR